MVRVEVKICPVCGGKQHIWTGCTDKGEPIWCKCPNCRGIAILTTYYEANRLEDPNTMFWIIPWQSL